MGWGLGLGLMGLGLASCSLTGQGQGEQAQAQQPQRGGGQGRGGGGSSRGDRGSDGDLDRPAVVEVLEASPGSTDNRATYTGTTEPRQQVSLRAQTSAQLLRLSVDRGDSVTQGQEIGELDPSLMRSALQGAQADLAVREAEVLQARTAVGESQAAIGKAQAELQQARVDAGRLRSLAQQGAVSQQEADLAQTALRVAEQDVKSAQQQFRNRTAAIAAAEQRVAAQRAVVAQETERLSFATLTAPISGTVLSRVAQAGDYIQSGQEVVTLGDLRDIQVVIEITDQDRGKVALDQAVQVQLDAFPGQTFAGTIRQISPVADRASRLIPVVIRLETSQQPSQQLSGQGLGSGLLARVNLSASNPSVWVPEAALSVSGEQDATLFVIGDGEDRVTARPIRVGSARNGQVEILSGLAPGDRYVAKSDRPLQDGQAVKRSLVSVF